jgi:SAM-dependent methyltransferase
VDTKWYEAFFDGVVVDMWRKALPPEATAADVEFLVRELGLRPGAAVLDVPCGHGRHAIPLASRGMRMTGVDLSRAEIDEARTRAAAAAVEIDWRHGDMRDLPWTAEFDGAFCFGNSFAYMPPDGTRGFLQAVARTLRPGARFAIDTAALAECILPRLREREWLQFGDLLFLEQNRYIAAESCIETTYTFVRDGRAETRTGLQWVHTARELRGLLADAGLEPLALYGALDGSPFEVGSHRGLVVAKRSP